MNNSKYELNVLINLAAIDHIIEPREAQLIYAIGKANQIPKSEIEDMMSRPKPIIESGAMTPEEKFDHLCYLIRMMKADGRIIKNEIDFCEHIAERLGYKKGVVRELSAYIYGDATVQTERHVLKKKSEKFIASH